MVSLLLPWGSVIFREDGVSLAITDVTPISLISGNDAVLAIGASTFIVFTLLTFLERWSAIGQLLSAGALLLTIPDQLRSIPMPSSLFGLNITVQIIGVGLGMVLGFGSAVIVIMSLYVEKRQGRYPTEDTLPNDQRPVVTPLAWSEEQRFYERP